jgi:hypothetical protein
MGIAECPGVAVRKKAAARKSSGSCGRADGKELLFFAGGFGGLSCLSGLGFDHALLEFVHAAGGVNEFLGAGVERVAEVAYTEHHVGLGGAGFDDVAAGAADFGLHVFRMNVRSHK